MARTASSEAVGVARIVDVAQAAGVSIATVSRVLNGKGNVASELSARVLRAANELGYAPYGPAQALRQRQTRVLAAIVADIENPFFTSMVRGVEDVAAASGYRLMLCNTDEDIVKESAYLAVAVSERMSGVVISVASTEHSTLELLLDRGIPVVAVDRRPSRDQNRVHTILVDNHLGATQATEHLLSTGSVRVACLSGPTHISTAAEREEGFRTAVASSGRRVESSLIRRADMKEQGGYAATRSLLAMKRPPDALFVANNLMTLGALRAIRESGRRIPADIRLVGFDDAPWTSLVTPTLSVVRQPVREMGRLAAKLLLSAVAGEESRHIVLAPELVVRESSAVLSA